MIKIETDNDENKKSVSVIMDFESYENAVHEFRALLLASVKSDLALNAFNDALDSIMK